MNRQVWKFRVRRDRFIEMPRGAEIVDCGVQESIDESGVYVWAIVRPDRDCEPRDLRYFATGEPVPDDWSYVGTAATSDRHFVWHVFERR